MRRLAPLLVLAWLIVGAFVVTHAYSLYDDAFIYFRFVDNAFAGCGVRWSCGDAPVEGFTSPLYFLLLLGTRFLSRDLESSSQVLGLLTVGASLCAAMILAARARRDAPVVPAALVGLIGLDGYFLLNATIGLETGLACAAVLAVFAAALTGRGLGGAIVIAILVRPELGVFALALPLVGTRRDGLVVIVGGLAIVAARWGIFADVLPNTFWAKTGGTRAHFALGLQYVLEIVTDYPLILAAPLALRIEGWTGPVRFVLAAAGVQLVFFLYSGGDTFLYSRLFMPFIPLLLVLAVTGLLARSQSRLVIVLLVFALGLGAVRHYLPPQHGFANVGRWETIGRWLRQNKPPTTKIAIVPIGAVGYFSRLPMIDLVGLATREVARGGRVPPELLVRSWIGHEKSNPDWVLAQQPDLIVFTKWDDKPWTLATARAGFWAEKQLLDAIRARGGYRVLNARIERDVYWLMFERE